MATAESIKDMKILLKHEFRSIIEETISLKGSLFKEPNESNGLDSICALTWINSLGYFSVTIIDCRAVASLSCISTSLVDGPTPWDGFMNTSMADWRGSLCLCLGSKGPETPVITLELDVAYSQEPSKLGNTEYWILIIIWERECVYGEDFKSTFICDLKMNLSRTYFRWKTTEEKKATFFFGHEKTRDLKLANW